VSARSRAKGITGGRETIESRENSKGVSRERSGVDAAGEKHEGVKGTYRWSVNLGRSAEPLSRKIRESR